jgi:hypothetical protein
MNWVQRYTCTGGLLYLNVDIHGMVHYDNDKNTKASGKGEQKSA